MSSHQKKTKNKFTGNKMEIKQFLDKILEKQESYIFAEVLEANTEMFHRKNLATKAAKKLGLNYSKIGDNELSSDSKFWEKLLKKAAFLAKKDYESFLEEKINEIRATARALKDFEFFSYDIDDLAPEIENFVKKYWKKN